MTPLLRIFPKSIRRFLLSAILPAHLAANPSSGESRQDVQAPASEPTPGAQAGSCPAAAAPALVVPGDRFASWVPSRELVYPSTDHRGTERLYSGRVYLPSPWLRRRSLAVPLVVYVHGTETRPDQMPQFNRGEEAMVGAMAAYFRNFAVAMPDLPGYGKDPCRRPHPYCHAKCLAHAVLDMVHPALKLLDAEQRPWDGRVFIVGYSSGGYGAMAAVKEWHTNPRYAWIPLAGAACMAGPFHFAESTRALLAGDAPYHRPDIQVLLLHAYHDLYPDGGVFSPDRTLHPRLLETRPHGIDRGNVQEWLQDCGDPVLFGQRIRFRLTGAADGRTAAREVLNPHWVETQLLSPHWPDTPAGRILKENDLVGGWQPKVPMLLATSPTDECVPARNTYAIMEDWTRAGCTAPVAFYPLTLFGTGVDHTSGAALALEKAFRWLGNLRKGGSLPLRSRL